MSEPTSNMYFHNMSCDLSNKILFKSNLQGVITPKKKIANFFLISPDNLLIIFYQLAMFEASSYTNFREVLISSVQCQICKGQ